MRLPLPGFIRRNPFPWLLTATVTVAFFVVAWSRSMEFTVRPHFQEGLNFLVQAVALVVPLWVTGAWWRRIGGWARVAALLVCGVWSLLAVHFGTELLEQVRAFARGVPVVDEMLREPLRALETPPRVAAARALAAGDTFFLGVGGNCGRISGVDSATALRYGVRVISGAEDDDPLTGKHRAFHYDASYYAGLYNDEVRDRLEIEHGYIHCPDPRDFRRAGKPISWP
jgi:hypothetical protein